MLVWLAVRQVDLPQLAEALRNANYIYVALAIGVYFVDLAIRAARWQVLLSRVGSISARRLYPVLAVGYMANNLLPGRVGEL
ncbi:MAG TPA: lysylphosphatidylglycerol synthase domain-containing protein, partial [Chloroflexota bacterium]|nr:lysylphosphatidylglycerol synthase domain-containing protein [Chloroflexota bacterium]